MVAAWLKMDEERFTEWRLDQVINGCDLHLF